jgi:hypothetical protein
MSGREVANGKAVHQGGCLIERAFLPPVYVRVYSNDSLQSVISGTSVLQFRLKCSYHLKVFRSMVDHHEHHAQLVHW